MGAAFLAGYVVTIGVATFLLKYVSDDFSPYQINLLMGVAMLLIGVPALLVAEGTLALHRSRLGLASLVGLLMAAGSVLYVLAIQRLPVGTASAVATSYVAIVVVLSSVVLHEHITPWKVAGLALTFTGVAVLSFVGG
jgi:drug/metabolite transporter (DMT)-like permease